MKNFVSDLRVSLRRVVEDPTLRFLALLVLADLAFFAIHFGYSPDGLLDEPRFRLDWDRGYAETFQYLKEFWIVLLLLYMALRDRAVLYLVFAVFLPIWGSMTCGGFTNVWVEVSSARGSPIYRFSVGRWRATTSDKRSTRSSSDS